MNQIALPVSAVGRKWTMWLSVPMVAIVIGALLWVFSSGRQSDAGAVQSMLYTVVPVDMPIKINKDGELQAVKNIEIVSQVEGQTAIQTLVEEGSTVKKDSILMTLDSANIKQKIEDTTLELQKSEADLTTSRELKDIQENQNAADLEAAQVSLLLAELDLKQYGEGTYPQQLANATTDLAMARINLKNQEEKLSQTRVLFEKQFVTSTAVQDDELTVTTARNTLNRSETALKVLTDYTHQMDRASKENAVSQAKQKLERTKRFNASNMAQRTADVQAKEQALRVMKQRMERYLAQDAACTIKAPADGLVVYGTSGDRNAQAAIQEGTNVRQQQPLFRLPDTSAMKAVVRIQEAQVARLREGQRARVKIVGVPAPLGATLTKISVLADSGQRFFNPDLKEYPVDLTLDETPTGLKPGMGALAEIYIDQLNGVVAVPLSAIFSSGQDSYVFVQKGDRAEPRKVRVGRTNETLAELTGDTVTAGEQVMMLQVGQGPELLAKAGIKVSTTQPKDDGAPGTGRRGGGGNGGGGRGRRGGNGGTDAAATPGASANATLQVAPKPQAVQ